MQRLLLLLVIGSLAGAAWLIAGGLPASNKADEGLVVHVFVADRAGKPVAPAQIIQAYDQKRTLTDGDGYVRLTHVTLRADEEPSGEALSVALKPLTRFHAPRRGFAPTVRKRDDGSWEVRYTLHAHGILRVHVESVALGKSKAFLEPDLPLQRWEPVGGHQVVRPGSVVDFRIYEDWTKVPLSFEGEPGPDGVPTVATQRLLIDAPSPGHTAQVRIIPEPVDPIAGVVRASKGPTPPTLRGRIVVRKVAEDGSKIEISETPIDDEGGFVVRDAGTGTYELEARLDAFSGATTVTAKGGDYVDLDLQDEALWLVIKHAKLDLQGRKIRWMALPPAGQASLAAKELRVLLASETETLLSIQHQTPFSATDSRYRVALYVPGSAKALPLRGQAEFGIPPSGMPTGQLALVDVPHATVIVRMDPATWGPATSARVAIGTRTATLVKGAKESVTLEHVAIDSDLHDEEVLPNSLVVTWNDAGAAPFVRALVLADGGRTELTVRRVEGGELTLDDAGLGLLRRAPDALFLDLIREDGSAVQQGEPEAVARVRLVRSDARLLWRAKAPLQPGRYRGRLRPKWPTALSKREAGKILMAFRHTFEIRAGETTTLKPRPR